jgi:hypothetical protein
VSFLVPGNAGNALSVGANGVVGSLAVDYSYDTVFFLNTDGQGRTQVMALGHDSSGNLTSLVLTWSSAGGVSFQPALAPADPNLNTQFWSIVLQNNPQMDGSFPLSGPFSVVPYGGGNALGWTGSGVALGAGGGWMIQQMPMVPAGLRMADIQLYTFSQGQSFTPALTQVGSTPKTWMVTPTLPSFLTFDGSSGLVAESAKAPQPLPVMAPASFTLQVTNNVGTQAPLSTTFKVSVSAG